MYELGRDSDSLLSIARLAGRVEFPELKRIADIVAAQWRPSAILVEDKASGQSLIEELKAATRLPILPVKVDSDKLARAAAVTPHVEAGKVFLPETAPWLDDYRDEMAASGRSARRLRGQHDAGVELPTCRTGRGV